MEKKLANTIIVCIIFLSLAACSPRPETENYVTRGEWITMLADGFGRDSFSSNVPRYADITSDNDLFAAVQALGEWGVLSIYSEDALNSGEPITRDEAASTAAIAAGFPPNEKGEFDTSASIDYAIKWGIVSESGAEYPTMEECLEVLDAAQDVYLFPPEEEKIEIEYSDDLIDLRTIDAHTVTVDGDIVTLPGSLSTGADTATVVVGGHTLQIKSGSTFLIPAMAEYPAGAAYKAVAMREENGQIIISTTEPTFGDIYDHADIHTTVSLDDSSITWTEGVEVSPTALNTQDSTYHIRLLSERGSGGHHIGPSRDLLSCNWNIRFNTGVDRIWKTEIPDFWGNSPEAQALNTSNFIYDSIPSLEDFSGSLQTWIKELEQAKKYSNGYDITIDMGLDLAATVDISYHKLDITSKKIELWPQSAYIIIDSDIIVDFKMEGAIEDGEKFEIGKVSIPVAETGLTVDGTLFLYMDTTGTIEVKLEMQNIHRAGWDMREQRRGYQRPIKGEKGNDASADVAGFVDLSTGAGLEVDLSAFSTVKLVGVDLKAGGDCEAKATLTGQCTEQSADGVTTRHYTETINLGSTLYLPIVSLTVSGPDELSDILGLEKSWEIVGKDNAKKILCAEAEWVIWETTATVGPDGEILDSAASAGLTHTYTTQWGDVNGVTYPNFIFEYPDNWEVTSEEVDTFSEKVILTSNTGATVTYWNLLDRRSLSDMNAKANRLYVKPVADASFVPGEVQGTDHSNLGDFMVARLTVTGTYDPAIDNNFVNATNGEIRYALLPGRRESQQIEYITEGLPTIAFWYSGHISLIASTPTGKFTEQEEAEVISILSNFREKSVLYDPFDGLPETVDTNTAETIEELWAMLEGTWSFETYEFMGEARHDQNYTMEFHYIDKKPCMSRYSQLENTYYPDIFFYDLSVLDTSHYIAYTYKKGSYGGEWENWGDDVLSVWYSFDLSNLPDGELLIGYHMAFDNGFVDNNHLFRYTLA